MDESKVGIKLPLFFGITGAFSRSLFYMYLSSFVIIHIHLVMNFNHYLSSYLLSPHDARIQFE